MELKFVETPNISNIRDIISYIQPFATEKLLRILRTFSLSSDCWDFCGSQVDCVACFQPCTDGTQGGGMAALGGWKEGEFFFLFSFVVR